MESAIYILPRWYSFSKPTNLGMIGVRHMNFGDYSAPVGFKIQEQVGCGLTCYHLVKFGRLGWGGHWLVDTSPGNHERVQVGTCIHAKLPSSTRNPPWDQVEVHTHTLWSFKACLMYMQITVQSSSLFFWQRWKKHLFIKVNHNCNSCRS